ncbi:MAG: hypothetical protein RIC16_06560 [Rhodospirillales bacterium]
MSFVRLLMNFGFTRSLSDVSKLDPRLLADIGLSGYAQPAQMHAPVEVGNDRV